MHPTRLTLTAFSVTGIQVRTINCDQFNPDIKRRFHTDFELYAGADEVALHIGIVS